MHEVVLQIKLEKFEIVSDSAWMECACYFNCDEWINARVNEDRKYYSDLQEKMINAHIHENKVLEDRWNNLLKREQKSKKREEIHQYLKEDIQI
jgi:6-phosphogluconolactonase/glucosamine-6-phosphate isomerase/deaminase